jgi:hypothetical protein
MKKNLIYFCYFKNSIVSEYTQYNLALLKNYIHIFDGEKIVKISVDNLDIDNSHLISLFDGFDVELVKNHSENRESEYFIELISQISDKNSITFYAHNKGGTSDNYHDDSIKHWLHSMYFFNLESNYLTEIESTLGIEKDFSGILRKEINCRPWVISDWHYSGTFFWFNTNRILNNSNITNFKKGRYGVEAFPGKMVELSRSHCTFNSAASNFDTYAIHNWNKWISLDSLNIDTYTNYINSYNKIFNKLCIQL